MGSSTLVGIAILLALAGFLLALWRGAVVLSRSLPEPQPLPTPPAPVPYNDAALHARISRGELALEKRFEELTAAVAHGIDHVDRNEKRVRGIVTGALRRFAAEGYEDPGVRAEVESLPEIDAPVGPDQEMSAMSNDVDPDILDAWGSVPGDTSEMTRS